MAVNQGIRFFLGYSKSALVSLTALIKRAENTENCPKDIHSYGNKRFSEGGWKQIVFFQLSQSFAKHNLTI